MKIFSFVLLGCLFALHIASAQAPRTISYQGVITDAAGTPISDGQHQIKIALYESKTSLTPLYSETLSVPVKQGVFNLIIGSVTPIPALIEFNKPYYLGTTVDQGTELTPRSALTAVPYAFHAEQAEHALIAGTAATATTAVTAATANALSPGATGVVTSMNGAEGALTLQGGGGTTIARTGNTITVSSTGGSGTGITGVQNTDGSLAIANPNGPVATLGVADNGITSGTIADGAVTTPKIGDGMVTVEKLAVNSVNTTQIMMNAVTAEKIANNSINGLKIENGSVSADKINPTGAVSGNVLTFDGTAVAWKPAEITFPYSGNSTTGHEALLIRHSSGIGIVGRSYPSYVGVMGISSNTALGAPSGAGVAGVSATEPGVIGKSLSGTGIQGISNDGSAAEFYVTAASNTKDVVTVTTPGSGAGVLSDTKGGAAIHARSQSGKALVAASGGTNIIEAYGSVNETDLEFRVLANGNVRCDGAFTGGGADVAEAVDVEGTKEEYEPGDVLVVSHTKDRTVAKSSTPNSTAVIGVYATKPGVLLAPADAETEIDHLVPMGVVGIIPTKVCGENGPIQRSDLLVTSSVPGHAMKAVPAMVNGVAIYPAGAIIGKALQAFDGPGSGIIEVMVNVK